MSTLTDLERINVRRWAGYRIATTDTRFTDRVVIRTGGFVTTLTDWLDNLTDGEETVLRETYLVPLASLETGVLASAGNMDTEKAGPWTANPRELAERNRLFDGWRRRMCEFIGIDPGPSLNGGGASVSLVRT